MFVSVTVVQNMEPPAWLEREKYNLTNDERDAILQFLLQNVKSGENKVLKFGAITQAAQKFKCNRHSVAAIWKRACESVNGDGDGTSKAIKVDHIRTGTRK